MATFDAVAGGRASLGPGRVKQNDFRIRQAHVVHGMFANREKRQDHAIFELAKSRPQDYYVIHQTALIYQATGVTTRG